MSQKIACPACRKNVSVAPSDAGQAVLCLACGQSFRAPEQLGRDEPPPNAAAGAPALSAGVADAPELVIDPAEDDDLIPGFPAPEAPAGAVPPRAALTTSTARTPTPITPTSNPGTASAPAERSRRLVWLGWAVAAGIAAVWTATAIYKVAAPRSEAAIQAAPPVQLGAASIVPSPGPDPANSDANAGGSATPPPADAPARLPDVPADAVAAATASAVPFAAPTTEPSNEAGPDVPTEVEPSAATGAAPADADTSPPTSPPPPTTRATPARVVRSRRGSLKPVPSPPEEVTDERIEQAIRRGVEFLASTYKPKKHFGDAGISILATYALIQCSLTVHDPRLDPGGPLIDKLIEGIKRYPVNPLQDTYERGVRATALSLLNRPQDRAKLEQDVKCLMEGHDRGAYTYPSAVPDGSTFRYIPPRSWDNSNSQYGLLGVWAGADAGVEVPTSYWEAVQGHWVRKQLRDGTWAYFDKPPGTVSMTAAGTASLLVAHEYLGGRSVECGRDPYSEPLRRALAFFETHDSWLRLPYKHGTAGLGTPGYTLYGIERVGLASGFKYLGKHDWFRALARRALDTQDANGSWRGGLPMDTSYHLLFLARGRPPVLMNKLQFNGYWHNRPRDAANLARFAGRALERPLNFQIIDARTEWHEWLDAPILYVASHEAPKFKDADYDKLRSYAMAGGMIFTHADCDSVRFDRFAEELVKELFPQYELVDLPADHPVYNLVLPVKRRPRLRAVSNGSRVLLVHSPEDLGRHWQLRSADAFAVGLNLFVYATGKRDLRNRLDSPYVPPADKPVLAQIPIVRVEYAGLQGDPEPAAWPRFANLFERRTGTALNVAPVKWRDLAGSTAPLAHLSGTAKYDPTDAEVAAMKAYVEGGGTLLIDTCGGTGAFASAMKDVLAKAFPGAVLDPIAPTHPMLNEGEPGMLDVSKPKYRPFTVPKQGKRPGLFGFTAGEGQVILTTLDVTSGLLHTGTWGINGFDPPYCESLVQNLVFWAHDTAPERFAAPPAPETASD